MISSDLQTTESAAPRKRFLTKKRILLFAVILVVGCIMGVFGSIMMAAYMIESAAEGFIYSNTEDIPSVKVGLVLGCSERLQNGGYNLFFRNRIDAAEELFKSGKVQYLLVSGDNHRKGYDEPGAMKENLIQRGIPEERIYCDYAGFRTLDSIVRTHKVFGQDEFIVISQEFHNKRAVYIGQNRGITVYGYNAHEVSAYHSFKTKLREKFARVKTVLDIMILNKQPKFPGEPVKIGQNHKLTV